MIKLYSRNNCGLVPLPYRTLSVQPRLSAFVSDSICENHIDMSSHKAKNVGKSLLVKGSIATTGQLLNKERNISLTVYCSSVPVMMAHNYRVALQCLRKSLTLVIYLQTRCKFPSRSHYQN